MVAPGSKQTKGSAANRAFGAENRQRLINVYFDKHGDPTPDDAWLHVYRMLLWADTTTGLAHCYESDKAQPGRHWHPRALRFHDWLSNELAVAPRDLADHMDWLFRHVVADLAAEQLQVAESRQKAADAQRAPYEGRDFPVPGEDPEMELILEETLGPVLKEAPPPELLRDATTRIRAYLRQENKRKNLLGEGFEDVLVAIIRRMNAPAIERVETRIALHEVGGFYVPRGGEKPRTVDLAVVAEGRRTMITAKWSVRADREEQFLTDYETYSRLESDGKPFEFYWVTNEFDPARLVASSDLMVRNSPVFNAVVHVAPRGVLAAYGDDRSISQRRVRELMEQGRIIGLDDLLRGFAAT